MSQRIEQQAKLQDSKTLTRHWDAFGRNVGYSVDGERKQSVTYTPPQAVSPNLTALRGNTLQVPTSSLN